jgi:hypothetical protein
MTFIINKIKIIFMAFKSSIKNFLQNIWDLFRQWFHVAEQAIKDNIHVAVVITENVKKFIDNPVGDFLLTVVDDHIPGNVSEKVKEILPKVLLTLGIISDCKELDKEETLKCIADHLRIASDDIKNVFYHSLAVTLAEKMSDGKISFGDAIALVEWYYRNQVKKSDTK